MAAGEASLQPHHRRRQCSIAARERRGAVTRHAAAMEDAATQHGGDGILHRNDDHRVASPPAAFAAAAVAMGFGPLRSTQHLRPPCSSACDERLGVGATSLAGGAVRQHRQICFAVRPWLVLVAEKGRPNGCPQAKTLQHLAMGKTARVGVMSWRRERHDGAREEAAERGSGEDRAGGFGKEGADRSEERRVGKECSW